MADERMMETEIYTPDFEDLKTTDVVKKLHMIFVVDTSGSMRYDGRIEAVNEAFVKMIPKLKDLQHDCKSKFELLISILRFDYTAEWIVLPTPILEYTHEEIPCSGTITNYGKAFESLHEKLRTENFMAHEHGQLAVPYIMFMTDGEPTDVDEYPEKLNILLGNGWFDHAERFAVLMGSAINNDKAKAAVERFVSKPKEGIINAAKAEIIAAEVQAQTLVTVKNMTQKKPDAKAAEGETRGPEDPADDPFSGSGTDAPYGGTDPDNPFAGAGSADDDIFGTNGNFE